jgi:glycosyltransferase involved in cell wall biosynthesis
MKVLQINTVCGTGSTGRIATDIHKILLDEGHESYIAYGRDLPKNCNNAIRIGSKVDNYTHALKTRVFDRHGFGSVHATHRFIEKVREIDPDIIHLHNIHGYYVNIEILFNYLKEANKPVVWTLHDCWSFTGHCAYFDYVGCEKWKTGCYECPQKKSYPASFLFDGSESNYLNKKEIFNGLKNMSIVTPSNWLKRMVEQSFLSKYAVHVINNGIDLNTFFPRDSYFSEKFNIQDKKIILGVANVWEERKGFSTFLELSRLIDDNYIIVLIGLSEKQIELLPNNIIGIRRTENIEELAKWYSISDVCANPSVEETFGLVTVEAMACGTPVVVYNATASPELVDEKVGIVVEKGRVDLFYKAIDDILNKERSKYEENCIRKVHENFDKKNTNKAYVDLYHLVVSNNE